MVLCMTVNPGWGGQALPRTLAEQARAPARADRPRRRPSRSTAGSTPKPPRRCAAAGATVFVAGTAVFGADDPVAAVKAISTAIGR